MYTDLPRSTSLRAGCLYLFPSIRGKRREQLRRFRPLPSRSKCPCRIGPGRGCRQPSLTPPTPIPQGANVFAPCVLFESWSVSCEALLSGLRSVSGVACGGGTARRFQTLKNLSSYTDGKQLQKRNHR